eukprot:3135324-Rhodomonas_salina.1
MRMRSAATAGTSSSIMLQDPESVQNEVLMIYLLPSQYGTASTVHAPVPSISTRETVLLLESVQSSRYYCRFSTTQPVLLAEPRGRAARARGGDTAQGPAHGPRNQRRK